MPYSIPTLSVCAVTIKAKLFGQRVMNTFYYQFTAGPAITDGNALLVAFDLQLAVAGNLYQAWRASVGSDVIDLVVDLQWIHPQRYLKYTVILGGVGDLGGCAFTNTAGCLTLRAVIADRRSLAHKHIPGLPQSESIGGVITGAYQGALDNLGNVASTEVTVTGRTMTPVVFGRARPSYVDKHGVTHPALPVSIRAVESHLVNDTSRVMRRRTVGVGE